MLDANLLIYAYDSGASRHHKTRAWIEEVFSGVEPVGLPWLAIYAFLRFMTNRKLPGERFTTDQASQILEKWLEQPNLKLIEPGDRHWPLLRRMLVEGQAPGTLVSDAVIAALTIEYGGVLHTADRGFARFPELRWVNPLA